MPAPPPDLTAASGAMVMDGGTSRRALTTAMLDLASRGLISFREDGGGILGTSKKVGVDVDPPRGDAGRGGPRALNARRPIGPAEEVALHKLRALGAKRDGGFISPDDLPEFGTSVAEFDKALERHVVARDWFDEAPSKAISRWAGRGALAIVGGVIARDRRVRRPDLGADPDRRGRDRSPASSSWSSPRRCRRSPSTGR